MGEEERAIKDKLQKLIERMQELRYKDFKVVRARKLVNELQRKGVRGIDKFLRKLLDSVNNKEGYSDICKEGRFAIILARNGFSEIIFIKEEKKHRLPDVKANCNRNTVYFEITRKRSKVDEWAEQPEDVELPSGKPEDIISIIQRKMGQLISGKMNILVFWSSTLAVLHLDMAEAFKCIQQEINQNPGTYEKLSGVVFTEDEGFSIPTMKQYYLFKNENASKPIGPHLAKKLKSLNALSPKQLKKKRERWSDILERN